MKFRMIMLPLAASLCCAAADSSSLRKAQEMLKEKGYYTGKVDGKNGPATKAAISAYQQAQGLPVTGALDQKTTSLLTPGSEANAAPAAAESSTVSQASDSASGALKGAGSSVKAATKDAAGAVKGVFKPKKSTGDKPSPTKEP